MHRAAPRKTLRCELDSPSLAFQPLALADESFRARVGEIAAEVTRTVCSQRGGCPAGEVRMTLSGLPATGAVRCTWETGRPLSAERRRSLEQFLGARDVRLRVGEASVTIALHLPV